MNAYLHRSEDRGHVKAGWLESYHSFSFGSWYDPKYMGVSALRVINDDQIDAHNGFGTHSHDNMEILTCVLDGAISHRDTMGNEGQIKAGEWQLMSAGTGVAHSEINNTDTPVHLLQIPRKDPNKWHLIAGPDANAPMHIRQNAEVKSAVLEKGHELTVDTVKKVNYVHVISGVVRIGDQEVKAGDALVFEDKATIHATEDSQFIWFDLP
ncbi:pirin family protein [Acinetobacter pittii]|uniref:pirin family protein n=1 Tax=Acinetobacter pittii TaxID=48296 RepID=UPI00202E3B0C|nr:pirin-like bicupin family protein [Acinetobacter pittii]MCM1961253.1 pirin family protein [Acinetobacter pittii]MCM1977479.1 pirin family protein [Acinetobacter pittii]